MAFTTRQLNGLMISKGKEKMGSAGLFLQELPSTLDISEVPCRGIRDSSCKETFPGPHWEAHAQPTRHSARSVTPPSGSVHPHIQAFFLLESFTIFKSNSGGRKVTNATSVTHKPSAGHVVGTCTRQAEISKDRGGFL